VREDNNEMPEPDEDDGVVEPLLDSLMASAVQEEPAVTRLLKQLEQEFDGELSGLEHKFKSRESLFRKIRKMVDKKRVEFLNAGKDDEVDISSVVWSTTDALRYTVLLPTEKYTAAVKAATKRFKEKQMEPNELKNFWPGGDNYQGINDVFRLKTASAPSGYMLFEIQFHTPESFKSKMDSHRFYETFRSTYDPMEKLKNWQALCKAAQEVPVPDGVLDIPNPRSNPNPGELELYAELVMKRTIDAQEDIKARVQSVCPGTLAIDTDVMKIDELESALRRMVDHDDSDSMGLQEAVNNIYEALNVLVALPEDDFVLRCQKAIWGLEGIFCVRGWRNGWLPVSEQLHGVKANTVGCGPGVSVHMTSKGEDDGVAFTNDSCLPCMVTFHTQASMTVQEQLTEKWVQYREARRQQERQDLAAEIRRLHESIRVPAGALEIERVGIMNV